MYIVIQNFARPPPPKPARSVRHAGSLWVASGHVTGGAWAGPRPHRGVRSAVSLPAGLQSRLPLALGCPVPVRFLALPMISSTPLAA